MPTIKTPSSGNAVRGEPLRQAVLDAAEILLAEGKADFSMRDLAAQAGVSFATPFNQFGSKAAIMHALSARRIDMMIRRLKDAPTKPLAAERVLLATAIGAQVMLEQSSVNRTVMGWLSTPTSSPGQVLEHSGVLWSLALGAGEGLIPAQRDEALRVLPRQIAFAFRGVLSFWTAGEIPDEDLAFDAQQVVSALLSQHVKDDSSPSSI